MSNSCLRINERLLVMSVMRFIFSLPNIGWRNWWTKPMWIRRRSTLIFILILFSRNSVTLTHLTANAILDAFYIPQEDWALLEEQINSENSESLLTKLQRAKHIRQLIINTVGVPNLPLLYVDLLLTSSERICWAHPPHTSTEPLSVCTSGLRVCFFFSFLYNCRGGECSELRGGRDLSAFSKVSARIAGATSFFQVG